MLSIIKLSHLRTENGYKVSVFSSACLKRFLSNSTSVKFGALKETQK